MCYIVLMKKIFTLIFCFYFLNLTVFAQNEPDYSQIKQDAIALYSLNKSDEAKAEFSKIPDSQKDSETWLLLGNIMQDSQKDIDAIYYYQKAITTNAKNYKAFYNLGNIYQKDDNLPMAIFNYKKAISINPEFAYSHYNLGCVYLKIQNYKNAKKSFEKSIILKKDEPDFYYNLSLTYKNLKKFKKAEETLKIYDDLIKREFN